MPVGFETDFASVPRLPVVYWLVGNLAHLPAVVHDYLYGYAVPRKVADKVFLEAMNACGMTVPQETKKRSWSNVYSITPRNDCR